MDSDYCAIDTVTKVLNTKENFAINQDIFLKTLIKKKNNIKLDDKNALLLKHLAMSFTRLFYEKMELLNCLDKDKNMSKEQKNNIKIKTEKTLLTNLLLAISTISYNKHPDEFILTESEDDDYMNKNMNKNPYSICKNYF
jgi:hypothetical protein